MSVEGTPKSVTAIDTSQLNDVQKRERLRVAANEFVRGQISLEEYVGIQREYSSIYPQLISTERTQPKFRWFRWFRLNPQD